MKSTRKLKIGDRVRIVNLYRFKEDIGTDSERIMVGVIGHIGTIDNISDSKYHDIYYSLDPRHPGVAWLSHNLKLLKPKQETYEIF